MCDHALAMHLALGLPVINFKQDGKEVAGNVHKCTDDNYLILVT